MIITSYSSTTGIASILMTKTITFKVSNSSSRQQGRNLIQKKGKDERT